MSLASASIRRPITTVMMYAALCLLGTFSMFMLPVDLMPQAGAPSLTVFVGIRGGLPPEDIESLVTKVVEDAVATTQHLRSVMSVSRKDRGAILPIGTAHQDVYWYQSGIFTTSTYYRDSLPGWVRAFNALRIPFKAAGHEYRLLLPDSAYSEPDSEPWEAGGHGVTCSDRFGRWKPVRMTSAS